MDEQALWYKDAIIYELHVRAFYDSNSDGIGDFKGLAEKLDYLHDLGINAVWLLPFYPSPLRDDGYDIADYENIHPAYGDLPDFKHFLKEARQRGIRVITELVLNHTSDEHPWFKRARRAATGSKDRDYYVWSDNPARYREARVIFKDFESSNWTWDRTAQSYYWHRFYSHQPDLNFDHPAVRKAMFGLLDFWLAMGVDGLRLDAVPYLYEREGTNCENLPETHAFLKELRSHIDRKFKNRMLLAEANQWPEDAVTYFGNGDECHMTFHFPIMPRLFMGIHMENRFPIIDILQQTPPIPDVNQWAIFLRNHDELTLEMVTDEERDYMYRVYANDPKARINLGIRRRLAPLLGNHRRKMELMNGLLFSLPGTPVIYYGDELGMGDNIYLGDRNGVRTPMQWSCDRNAGFSRANPQKLYLPINIDPEYHYETVNVEAQTSNPHSLLWWMKRLIALRKRYKAFSRGTVEFLSPENPKVLAFIRHYEDEHLLIVANLSRFVQFVEMDLSTYKSMVPVEMFGRIEFPSIGELPYFITLGPHSFYWFSLEPAHQEQPLEPRRPERELKKMNVRGDWEDIFDKESRGSLEKIIAEYIKDCRWFGSKARKIRQVQILETIPVPFDSRLAVITVLRVDYLDKEPDRYILPLAFATDEKIKEIQEGFSQAVIAKLAVKNKESEAEGILYDAIYDRRFAGTLLESIRRRRIFKGKSGDLASVPTKALKQRKTAPAAPLEVSIMKAEQSNTSAVYGDQFILKFFRRFEEGVNPDLEIGRYLTEKTQYGHMPAVAGSLEYINEKHEPVTVGILQAFVPNQGDAWKYTLDALAHYFERVLARPDKFEIALALDQNPFALSQRDADPLAMELINPYLETARLLGVRTAELHRALSHETEDPAFAPEPFTPFYQRSLYQSMRNLTRTVFQLMGKRVKTLPADLQREARSVLEKEPEILKRFQSIVSRKMTSIRIRPHGDFHLGQVLYTGKDFVIIDFEGEPARSLEERRIKRSPLRDVAGMLRSFHYAAYSSLYGRLSEQIARKEDIPGLEPWAHFWFNWAASAFLRAYLQTAKEGSFLPKDDTELEMLLNIYFLEKAVYELNYELNHRPDWIVIPIKGITQIIQPA